MRPSFFWRCFNLLRRSCEDYGQGDATLVPQLKRLWKKEARVVSFPRRAADMGIYRDERQRYGTR